MESYTKLIDLPPDFRVSYRLYSAEEGGRRTPAPQHIRWNFRYDNKEISTSTFMIWPEILLLNGEMLQDGYIPNYGLADMFILLPAKRAFHQQHIKPGIRGYFVEGSQRIAACEVIAIVGLYNNPVA